MLQRPIYNSELIEIPLPLSGVGKGQAIKFPTINRLKDVYLIGFAVYTSDLLLRTPSGFLNGNLLELMIVDLQNQKGMSPYKQFPANAANPLMNFGFSQDVNPIFFDSAKSTIQFNFASGVFAELSATVINAFFLHKQQFDDLRKRGYFKDYVEIM